MIHLRLFLELLLPVAVVALLTTIVAIAIGSGVQRQTMIDGEIQRLRTGADAVAVHSSWFHSPPATWHDEFRQLSEVTELRFTILDGRGTALADSRVDVIQLDSFAGRTEIREARRQGWGAVEINGRKLALAVAVREPPEVAQKNDSRAESLLGFVRTEADLAPVVVAVARWRMRAFALASAAGLLGLIAIAFTTYHLAEPIETFFRAASVASTPDDPALQEAQQQAATSTSALSTTLTRLATSQAEHIERVRREAHALKASSERMAAVLTGMAEGVLAVDRHDRILLANPAAASLLDLSDTKLAGRPLWEAIRIPAIQAAAREARNHGDTRPREIELSRTQTILALQATNLPGEPSPGVVLVMHDMTELRRLENLRQDFVGNVSHELKTPLASIKAYTETLLEGAIDDQENNVRFLKRIDEQAERLHNLILDLLRLARIEAGTDVFEITRLHIGQIVEPCIDTHLAIARTRSVQLITLPPVDTVRVNADADGLRTILDNLVDNAIRYTPAGGSVTVRWERKGNRAVIEVADTGIGIPAEHLPRIFERFHRVDKARNREHGGTGLGLAIVKHLAQVFGGRVEVDSELGRGSTFRVELPGA